MISFCSSDPIFPSQVSAAENNKKQDQLKAEITSLRQQLQQKEGEITQLKHDLHLAVTTLVSHLQLFESSTLALEKQAETYGRLFLVIPLVIFYIGGGGSVSL